MCKSLPIRQVQRRQLAPLIRTRLKLGTKGHEGNEDSGTSCPFCEPPDSNAGTPATERRETVLTVLKSLKHMPLSVVQRDHCQRCKYLYRSILRPFIATIAPP